MFRGAPSSSSFDKSAAIPSQMPYPTVYIGYLHYGRIPIVKQPDVARVHGENSTIPSFI